MVNLFPTEKHTFVRNYTCRRTGVPRGTKGGDSISVNVAAHESKETVYKGALLGGSPGACTQRALEQKIESMHIRRENH